MGLVLTIYRDDEGWWWVQAYMATDGMVVINMAFERRKRAESYARGLRDGIGMLPMTVQVKTVVGKRNGTML